MPHETEPKVTFTGACAEACLRDGPQRPGDRSQAVQMEVEYYSRFVLAAFSPSLCKAINSLELRTERQEEKPALMVILSLPIPKSYIPPSEGVLGVSLPGPATEAIRHLVRFPNQFGLQQHFYQHIHF